MDILNSRLYTILEVISFFFLLNVLWLVVSLPIITIFPATAAMFGVIRNWVTKQDSAIFVPFFRFFKENFIKSFIAGIIFLLLTYIFYLDFTLVKTLNTGMQNVLLAALFLFGIIVTFTLIYFFPMMVHYHLSFKLLIKNSFLFSMKYIPTTILSIISLIALTIILIYMPFTFLFIFSIMAYVLFLFCYSKFKKEEAMVKNNQKETAS